MQNLKMKLIRFLSTRYGNDALNKALFWIAMVVALLNIFLFKQTWLTILVQAILILSIFRSFSGNIWARQKENRIYMEKTIFLRHSVSCFKKQAQDKEAKYFVCPKCAQIVRVPKGKGKIEIRCPKCHQSFDRRS